MPGNRALWLCEKGFGCDMWVRTEGWQHPWRCLGLTGHPEPRSAGRFPPLTTSTWVHTWLKCCVWDCCDSSCDRVTLSKAFSPLPPAPYDFYCALEGDAADVGQPPSYPQSFSSPSEPVKVPAHSIKYSHSPQLPVVTLQRHKAIRKTAVPIM